MDYRLLLILLLFCCVTPFNCDDSITTKKNENSSDTTSGQNLPVRQERAYFQEAALCAFMQDRLCLFDIAEDYLHDRNQEVLAIADAEVLKLRGGRAEEEETPSQLVISLSKLFGEFTNLFKDGFYGWFKSARENDNDDEVQDGDAEETTEVEKSGENGHEVRKRIGSDARKKKKNGKIHKLIFLIKVLIAKAVLAIAILILLKAIKTATKVKLAMVAAGNLLLNVAKFYWDIKKGKHDQKVIYYEHAQHQHHYDGGDEDWDHVSSPGHDDSHGGGYWGRAYSDDGTSSQHLAYAKQKPGRYNSPSSKAENEPSGDLLSSWF